MLKGLKIMVVEHILKKYLKKLEIFVHQKKYFGEKFWIYMLLVLTMMLKMNKQENFLKRFKTKCIMQFMVILQEVIFNRVDSQKENIGLTNFKGNIPTKAETEIAKNYLSKKEL